MPPFHFLNPSHLSSPFCVPVAGGLTLFASSCLAFPSCSVVHRTPPVLPLLISLLSLHLCPQSPSASHTHTTPTTAPTAMHPSPCCISRSAAAAPRPGQTCRPGSRYQPAGASSSPGHRPQPVPMGPWPGASAACVCTRPHVGQAREQVNGGWVSFLCQVLFIECVLLLYTGKILPFNIEVHTSPFPEKKYKEKLAESQREHACWELIFSCYPNDPMRQEVIFPAVFQLSGTSMLQSIRLHRQGQPTGLKF